MRFERREPDRGSRVREDEIGERWPEVPEWADPRELDPEVRRDLRGLSKEGSEFVAGHLFMAGMLMDEDPALAWRHARAARSKGGRIAVVRETVGLVAYRAAEWAEAIAELRAARRMSGGPGQLPVMADCERALGHPEKAIELSRSVEAADLDPSSAAELRIVVAGARADMGQLDAALAHLDGAVKNETIEPFTARLFYAYADLLLQAGRRDEAIDYFMRAADLDVEEETDAGDRLTELADEEAGLPDAPALPGSSPGEALLLDDEGDHIESDETEIDTDLDIDSDVDTDRDTDTDTDTDTSTADFMGGEFDVTRSTDRNDGPPVDDTSDVGGGEVPTIGPGSGGGTGVHDAGTGLDVAMSNRLDRDDDKWQQATEDPDGPASVRTIGPDLAESLFSHDEGGR